MPRRPLKTFISSADDLLQLDLSSLGRILLEHLKSYEGDRTVWQQAGLNRGYFVNFMEARGIGLGLMPKEPEYGADQPKVTSRMLEAWNWLERQGFLMHNPDQPMGDWFLITTEGERWFSKPENNGKSEVSLKEPNSAKELAPRSRKIFIVHGHDDGTRETVARFLERADFQPIILHEQASSGRTLIEKVEAHSEVGFAVVLLTPDDEGCAKGGTPLPRARQNVVLELGYFIGRLGRHKVCALKVGDSLEIPSDFGGVVYVPFDNSGGWRQTLAKELEAVGFEIDWGKAMGNRS